MLPSQYHPTKPEEFIGTGPEGAATIARFLQKMIVTARQHGNAPLRLLLAGNAGIGKSELVLFLQRELGCDQWSTTKLNGTQVKVEAVEEIAASLHFKSLFNDYRLLWIDEADEIPRVAQVRLLTLIDDLPAGVAIVCTSNCKLKNFEERFQSRFQFFEVKAPAPAEIEALVLRFVGDKQIASQIATFACGNVRQALRDAEGVLQQAA